MAGIKLKSKYVIGCHVMFYEIEIFQEYVDSLINAIGPIENKDVIKVQFVFNTSQYFENINTNKISKDVLNAKFKEQLEKLRAHEIWPDKVWIHNNDRVPYTMTDYRRWLNDHYCNEVDYVIWGETDCLLPKKTFELLEGIKNIANEEGIYKYITTFAVRKMWDDSWKILEHPEFTDKPLLEKSNPLCWTERYSIRSTWDQSELDQFNSKYENSEAELLLIDQPKFDGSLLCISSDLIKEGCNIPHGIIGLSGEDTSFMYSCLKNLGKNYKQIVVKNILKIHNREHPKKRMYCLTPDNIESTQQNKGEHYKIIRELSKRNLEIYWNCSQERYLTWDDFKTNK